MELDELFTEHILDHFECPYHKGHLDCATCQHADRNPICGDQISLELRVGDDGRIEEAWFDGKGCAISQAAASMLCETVEGKTLAEVKAFSAPDMLDLIKVPLTASRQKCGLLGFRVLKTMLYSLSARDSPEALPRHRESTNGNAKPELPSPRRET